MLVRVQVRENNPRSVAQTLVEGGLLYSRVSRSSRLQELTRGAEYSRGVREWIPRRSNLDWKTPRACRISYPAGRTVCLHRPPSQGTSTGLLPVRAYPEGWGLPFDGLEASAYWEKRYHRVTPPGGPAGTPYLEVAHRGGSNFTAWSARRLFHPGVGLWGHRPRKEQDPIRGVYDYLHRGGCSSLEGLRHLHSSREEYLATRLSRLYRRQREHQLLNFSLESLQLYRRASQRKKKPLPQARELFFRRRRLRGYLTGVVSHRNYINRLTRRGFYRWHPNRWARLEKVSLLGGAYVEPRTTWGNHLLGFRVGTPLEYNLYSPFAGFGRLLKRRRQGARRWKLGQHTVWGPPHLQARAARWSWFKETPLGALLDQPPLGAAPPTGATQGSLLGGVYWSAQVWGRSRWTRPVGRQATGFVWALKGGTTVEKDSQQWGRAGTSGVGIFLSLAAELELRTRWASSSPSGGARDLHSSRGFTRGGYLQRKVWYFVRWLFWAMLAGVWFLFTPVWKIYAFLGQGFCYTAWWIRRGWWRGRSISSAGSELITQLGTRLVWTPLHQYVVHWVKDTPFFKTLSWVWVSWVLVYSSDDDQSKLNLTPAEASEDGSQEYSLDEIEPTGENVPDEERDDDIHEGVPRIPYWESWGPDLDFAYDEGLDHVEYFFFEEIPYRVGFFFQPLLDVALRLPLWGLLEGFSLLTLTVKLEYQRGWAKVLSRGGSRKGRWWKIPLLLLKGILHFGVWLTLIWVAGSTLSYSTLRLEVVLCGWPWREEYYLFWWGLITVLVTKLVGPRGVKNFFFNQIGWANLGGLFWGATEVAQPESYQPDRPVNPLVSGARTLGGINMRRHKSYDDILYHVRETDLYAGGQVNAGFDETLLVLAHMYEHGDSLNWDEADEENYFNIPLHLAHSLEEETDPVYSIFGVPKERNEFRSRGFREPHLVRTNYYDLTYDSMLGRYRPPVYFEADLINGIPMQGSHLTDSVRLNRFSRDESQIQTSSDTSDEFNT